MLAKANPFELYPLRIKPFLKLADMDAQVPEVEQDVVELRDVVPVKPG
jgi:hypothetical protein